MTTRRTRTGKGSPAARQTSARAASLAGSGELLRFGAIGKAFTILEAVTGQEQPLSMADIARDCGMSKPTAHRVISQLQEMGFVERDHGGRGLREGPRLVAFALATLRASSQRAQRHTILSDLSEAVGETCNFGVLNGSEVIYLDRVEAKWPLGLRFEPGSRVPAHCTAIGKLLLSLLAPSRQKAMLNSMTLTRYTPKTITDCASLSQALQITRQSGIGTDDQEFMSGVVCIAVPVYADADNLVGGIAVSAPEARIALDEAMGFVSKMKKAAKRLGATFDGSTATGEA